MTRAVTPDEAFARIAGSLAPILQEAGFHESAQKWHSASFGSGYATYERSDHELRLVWDGKEAWFVLEARPRISAPQGGGWLDLDLQRFEPGSSDEKWVEEMVADFTVSLTEYLKSPVPGKVI